MNWIGDLVRCVRNTYRERHTCIVWWMCDAFVQTPMRPFKPLSFLFLTTHVPVQCVTCKHCFNGYVFYADVASSHAQLCVRFCSDAFTPESVFILFLSVVRWVFINGLPTRIELVIFIMSALFYEWPDPVCAREMPVDTVQQRKNNLFYYLDVFNIGFYLFDF